MSRGPSSPDRCSEGHLTTVEGKCGYGDWQRTGAVVNGGKPSRDQAPQSTAASPTAPHSYPKYAAKSLMSAARVVREFGVP
jgi:hypothetical protein